MSITILFLSYFTINLLIPSVSPIQSLILNNQSINPQLIKDLHYSLSYSNLSQSESLITKIANLLIANSNEGIKPLIDQCSSTFNTLVDSNSDIISQMITNSGKGIADIGLEYDCIKQGLSYYLITFNIGQTDSTSREDIEIIKLLGTRRDFFIGLCLIKDCNPLMTKILSKGNEKFTKYLNSTFAYTKVAYLQEGQENIKVKYPITYVSYFVVSVLILIWIIVKLLATFFGNFTLRSDEISYRRIKNIMYEEDNNDLNSLVNDDTLIKSREQYANRANKDNKDSQQNLFFNRHLVPSNESGQEQGNQPRSMHRLWFKLMDFLSIGNDLIILTSTKNDYYTEKGLKMISFYRMILMFLIIFNHYFYTLYKYPGRDFFNADFYSSVWFFMVKLTVFAADCFMALDAFVTGYKLMSYLKKNINHICINGQYYYGKLLIKFSLHCIPKIVAFFANFYIIHVFAPYYSNLLTDGSVHEYYLAKIAKEKECERDPGLIFIPFYMAYYDYHQETNMSFSNCYRFVNVYLNQFYIFIIFLLLFYLMCKLRSKVFDASIGIFVILNSIFSYLTFYTSASDGSVTYNFYTILGQNLTLKHPHLFFNTYMLGIFSGCIYFYYIDVLSKNPIVHTSKYTPFSFCHSIMKSLDSLSIQVKYLIVFVCLVVQLVLSMSYNIFREIYQPGNIQTKALSFKIQSWMNVYDCYDKQLFTLLFLLTVTILIITPNDSFFRQLSNANIFTMFSRINFAIFSCMDSIIYVAYCVYSFQLKMTYPNLIYMSIGEYGLVTIVCVAITILFEIPVRIGVMVLIRKKMRWSVVQESYNNNLGTYTEELSEVK